MRVRTDRYYIEWIYFLNLNSNYEMMAYAVNRLGGFGIFIAHIVFFLVL